MTTEEKADIILRITEKCKAEGIKVQGNYITIEEMLVSPDVAQVIFGTEYIDIENDPEGIPAWRFHQHQLLDFMQSYNTDEMLRYVESYV